MENKHVFTAVVLAGGNGSRMHSKTKKQFMELCGEKVIVHSLRAFENNPNIKHIVLVVPQDETTEALGLCLLNGFRKIRSITEGGEERFISVYNGISQAPEDTDYVLIHDGVRPLVTQELIDRCCKYVPITNACIAAVPVKDTIKKADRRGFAAETPDRRSLWAIQTPQAFSLTLLKKAYEELYKTLEEYGSDVSRITDDAVIVENMTDTKVRLVKGDERNIKITTPSDMIIAEALFKSMR